MTEEKMIEIQTFEREHGIVVSAFEAPDIAPGVRAIIRDVPAREAAVWVMGQRNDGKWLCVKTEWLRDTKFEAAEWIDRDRLSIVGFFSEADIRRAIALANAKEATP